MFRSSARPSTSAALACLLAFAWVTPGRADEKTAPPAASSSFPLVDPEPEPVQPSSAEPEPGSAPVVPDAPDAEKITPPASPETATGAPCVPEERAPAPASTAELDPDAPFRAFAIVAQQERMRRYGAALGGVLAGGSSIVLGAILKSEENINPDVFYVAGGVAIGSSLLALFLPSPFEMEAKGYRVGAVGHSLDEARSFEKRWAAWAESAKRHRLRNSFGSMVVGAGFAGVGVAFLAGAGSMSDDDRTVWGSLLLGSGVAMAAAGGMGLLLLSPVESSYRLYAAAQPAAKGSQVSLRLRPFGIGLAANGTF